MVDIEVRLREGWRPAQSRDRLWVRGGSRRLVGEDWQEDLSGAETAEMTPEEEQALIDFRWSSTGAPRGTGLELTVVEDAAAMEDGDRE